MNNRILSRFPCDLQLILVGYLSYIEKYVYVNPKLVFISLPNPVISLLVTISLFSKLRFTFDAHSFTFQNPSIFQDLHISVPGTFPVL